MSYDFDKSVDRRNTHSLKWDVKEKFPRTYIINNDSE